MKNLPIKELKEMYANIFPTGMSKYSRAIAELIAIRERKGDPVPYGYYSAETATILEQQGHANISAEPLADSRFPLFTAPQKPVVLLNSSTVMSRAYVVRQIEAAGCIVQVSDTGKDCE